MREVTGEVMRAAWRSRAWIDTTALGDNLAVVRERAAGCKVMAVVKADAYGHGSAVVTRALADRVDAFAVATVQEGIACRETNPSIPITLLSGFQPAVLAACTRYQLEPVVYAVEQVEWLEKETGAPPTLWLKMDTGMTRLGIEPDQACWAIARLRRNPRIQTIRLMSHLANADEPESDHTEKQLARFRECTDEHDLERSLANSAGVMAWPQTHFQWVRPGIMLYGGSPFWGAGGSEAGLRPVMQLEARLLAVKSVAAGQPVGYGGTFITAVPTQVGVVGFGYGDGYPRVLNRAAEVLIGGVRAPIIGRVTMDMTMVDVSGCAAAVGDTVVLWGSGLSVDEVAEWAGTQSYELLCKVGARVPRMTLAE